jgi:hypothetical protein
MGGQWMRMSSGRISSGKFPFDFWSHTSASKLSDTWSNDVQISCDLLASDADRRWPLPA